MTKKQLRAIIGENIRLERVARNISIEELSEMLDLTPGFVGLIERGQRGTTSNTLYKLADVFTVSIDSFFYVKNPSELDSNGDAETSSASAKRKKIESMLVNFSDKEMDFVISVLKNLRAMNRSNTEDSGEPDED